MDAQLGNPYQSPGSNDAALASPKATSRDGWRIARRIVLAYGVHDLAACLVFGTQLALSAEHRLMEALGMPLCVPLFDFMFLLGWDGLTTVFSTLVACACLVWYAKSGDRRVLVLEFVVTAFQFRDILRNYEWGMSV